MSNKTKGTVLKISALAIDILVPLCATLSQFPLWVSRSAGATMSGITLVLILLSVIPLLRYIKRVFSSPSAWLMWTLSFIFFSALDSIIAELKIICFFGMIANLLGAFLYNLGKRFSTSEDK